MPGALNLSRSDLSSDSAAGFDPALACEQICRTIRHQLDSPLRRRGLVVGMSGGIDSSVCAALAARAVSPARVLGLFMPDPESDSQSLLLARDLADRLGIAHVTEPVGGILQEAGCYRRRDDAIRRLVPAYGDGWRCKVVLPEDRMQADLLNVSYLVIQDPSGRAERHRLPPREYREIVAAMNFKQRTRTMLEYYHADRLHYAVVGTPNRLEYDQGFFVKGGDGAADLKPIAHLYKRQVYELAGYLGLPDEIAARRPTTDTYSLPQSQEEFYFGLPIEILDAVLEGLDRGASEGETAAATGLSEELVARAYQDLARKRMTTRYLHLPPLLVEPVSPEPEPSA